jgi:hypothetical protein
MCCTNRNDELSCDISLDFLRFKHNTRYNTPLNRASPQLIEVGDWPCGVGEEMVYFALFRFEILEHDVEVLNKRQYVD